MIRIGTERWTFWVTASAKVLADWLWHNAYEDSPYPRPQLLFTWFEDEAYESGARVKWHRYEHEYGVIDLSASFYLADGRPHGIHAGSGFPVRFRLIPLAAERTEVRAECLAHPAPGLYERFQHVLEEISKQWPTAQKQEERPEDLAEPPALEHSAQREPGQNMASSNRIFIVHGLNDAAKYELKNYVQNTLQLGEPVILHEQPSMGRTIIEKFEEHAKDVDVVFVLLTPDDKLCSPSDTAIVKQRARQNVIFELGYFYGKLQRGSGRVLLLYQGDLDLPSDISGIVYIDISNSVEAAGERIRRELAIWL